MRFSILTVFCAAVGLAAALPTATTGTGCASTPSPSPSPTPSPPCDKFPHFHKHNIKSGETLGKLAQRYHSGICNIASLNHIADPNVIFAGDTILIPVNICDPDNKTCLTPPGTHTCVQGGPATYTVQAHETFYTISQKLGLTVEALTGANPGIKPENLFEGEVINVPVCK